MATGGHGCPAVIEVVDVDLLVVEVVVVVVNAVAGLSLARVFAARVRLAVLRSVLVLEVEQLKEIFRVSRKMSSFQTYIEVCMYIFSFVCIAIYIQIQICVKVV
jgi:hypothetical protein